MTTPAHEVQGGPCFHVHGEPSYRLANENVELYVTRRGGHLAPAFFQIGDRRVSPYALAPWQPQDYGDDMPPLLRVLRGDFFCLPFGPSEKNGPIHGETANGTWEVLTAKDAELTLQMTLHAMAGQVIKRIRLNSSHRAIYQEHTVFGLTGKFSVGYHAILQFPEEGGPYKVNTSAFHFGSTNPVPAGDPAVGEYSILKPNAEFSSLAEVPLATGGTTSLQDYPNRAGYEDIAMVSSQDGDFAWTAATLDGYVWISLKDPRMLPNTVFWMSNGGRHTSPWEGRHRRRLGLEEVAGYFADGLEASREERLQEKGVPTVHRFSAEIPARFPSIHVVHPVPDDFGLVADVERASESTVTVRNEEGDVLDVPVDWQFLYEHE